MSISLKELKENNYCLPSSDSVLEIVRGTDKSSYDKLFDVLKDIEHLLIDEDRLFFSRLYSPSILSPETYPVMYVYRNDSFKITIEKFTEEDNYHFKVECYDKSVENYKDGINFNSNKKSCINWLTKVLIDGSFTLEVI